jgi:hypothetical protein
VNTKGHHQVLDGAVATRLRRAFAEAGLGDVDLQPLFLGNWLADLSQVNDPSSTFFQQISEDLDKDLAAKAAPIRAILAAALKQGQDAQPQQPAPQASRPAASATEQATVLRRMLKLAEPQIRSLVDAARAVVGAYSTPDPAEEQAPTLGEKLISLVRVVGYCKFAHADPAHGRPGIPFPVYTTIFDELCRQYFPHEHLDRPLCALSYGPPCEAAWGPAPTGKRDRLFDTRRSQGTKDRHLYNYLVDDRLIIAGRLAAIDRDWASRAFSDDPAADEQHKLWLARLGHTLHGVEDFFAHSNFVEHAIFARGPDAMRSALAIRKTGTAGSPAGTDLAAIKVDRRLKRYVPGRESIENYTHPREDAVVTGYFDAWDTLNSLLHLAEELIRPRVEALANEQAPAVVVIRDLGRAYLKQSSVDDILDLFDLLTRDPEESFEAKASRAVAGVLEYFSQAAIDDQPVTQSSVVAKVKEDRVLAALPEPLVRNALAPLVLGLVRTVKVGKAKWTTYKAVKTLLEFEANPVGFLLKPLREDSHKLLLRAAFGILVDLVAKPTLVRLNYLLLEELHELFRADRIGCHSLLAKDTPVEPLFDQMFTCARHVDWYVTDALCRWADKEWVKTTQPQATWIRWDELLGFFLRAPVDTPSGKVRRASARHHPSAVNYTVTTDDQTFSSIYQRVSTSLSPAQLPRTYQDMLKANVTNYDTSGLLRPDPIAGHVVDERGLPEAVELAGLGVRRGSGYELRRGLTVTIPIWSVIPVDVVSERDWYWDAMELSDDAWRRAASTYEATRLRESPAHFAHYTWTYFSGRSDTAVEQARDAFITATDSIRKQLEMAYNQRS